MRLRGLALAGALLALAACGGGGEIPPPVIEEPRLSRTGELSGVAGLTQDDWNVLDRDLKRAVFRLGFLERLGGECRTLFPEHDAFLGEFALLVQRGLTGGVERAIAMETERLRLAGDGRERAVIALLAMRRAEMDVAGMMADQVNALATEPVDGRAAVVSGCGLIFEKQGRRDLMRTVSVPLDAYFTTVQAAHPVLHGEDEKITRIRRILARI